MPEARHELSKAKKRRAGILPASFVAAGWKPALLFQFAILALAITWTGLVAPFCFAQSTTAQEKTATTAIPPPPAQSLPRHGLCRCQLSIQSILPNEM